MSHHSDKPKQHPDDFAQTLDEELAQPRQGSAELQSTLTALASEKEVLVAASETSNIEVDSAKNLEKGPAKDYAPGTWLFKRNG